MRQRITFIQEPQDSVDPKNLKVSKNSISTTGLKAAREERITFGFDELPQELYKVLKAAHEIHIRWVGERPYESLSPLVARLSPGLHVFYSGQKGNHSSELLCPLLQKAFGDIDCVSPQKSFTTLPTERFSHSAATQYYSPLASLSDLESYLSHKICSSPSLISEKSQCLSRVQTILSAATLDVDFDTISHALTLTAFFPPQTQDLHIQKPSTGSSRLEVGILSVEKPQEPEELSLGGFLTVIGEDTKPSPTLFSFPARHHPLSSFFSSSFIQPTGLHPNLEIRISSSKPPLEDRACALHTHLTLPREIFADKYQLSDPLFLASKNLSAIHYITSPVDLEAPAYALSTWGSSVLLELAPPTPSKDEVFTVHIPLHLRYLPPSSEGDQTSFHLPSPVLFWACTADEGSKFPINPFDKVNIGYDGLFGPRTLFYHLSPQLAVGEERLGNTLIAPVLELGNAWYVEGGTAVVVMLGFVWVLWCLGRVFWGSGIGNGRKSVEKEKKDK